MIDDPHKQATEGRMREDANIEPQPLDSVVAQGLVDMAASHCADITAPPNRAVPSSCEWNRLNQ